MRITLFDIQPDLVAAWEREFADVEEVSAAHTPLADLAPRDCLVSPANSFGILDGGLDLRIRELLPEVQERVSAQLAEEFLGEQPVGTSTIVPTGAERFPWLAHTPTMRVPRLIPAETVYDAMRAMLLAVRRHNGSRPDERIETIACPGLGTMSGGVDPPAAARLMRLAYASICVAPPRSFSNWKDAEPRVRALYDPSREP